MRNIPYHPVILASQSPRRQELLARITEDFVVCPADVDESLSPACTPKENVRMLAKRKAAAVFAQAEPEDMHMPEEPVHVSLPEILPPTESEPYAEPDVEETVPAEEMNHFVEKADISARPEPMTKTESSRQKSPGGASSAPAKNAKMNAAEAENEMQAIAEEIEQQSQVEKTYVFPPVDLLKKGDPRKQGDSRQHLQQTALKLQQTLKNFGVNVTISNVSCGPTVTRYEIQPEMGVKVSKIVNLTDDIKLNLAAADIRIEAPIPGKAAVGIEVPNSENVMVSFRELIESKEFQEARSKICFAVGRDIAGNVKVADIAKMPHVLIAGATGSGKSVCINTIIMSILYKADPSEVKLIMIAPKVVELSVYNGIPHLLIPVVTDPRKAAGAASFTYICAPTTSNPKISPCTRMPPKSSAAPPPAAAP